MLKEDELAGACSMYMGEEKCIRGFGGKPEGGDHLENLGAYGRIPLKWILRS